MWLPTVDFEFIRYLSIAVLESELRSIFNAFSRSVLRLCDAQ
jgi:hypothetical protein